jgi:hypothetical protein
MNLKKKADEEATIVFIVSMAQYFAQITLVIGAFITIALLAYLSGII